MTREYTAEQKAEALAMYEQEGCAATSRALGIPKGTISTWVRASGTKTVVASKTVAATEQARLDRQLHQELMIDEMIVEARAALADMRKPQTIDVSGTPITVLPNPKDRQHLGTTFGIIFDKIQLATGGVTSRNEEVATRLEKEQRAANIIGIDAKRTA